MLNLQLRVVNDNGTVNSATSRVLPTAEIVYTSAINTPSGLTFKVSRDDFVPAQFPFVVRVEKSVNGGAYSPTAQNSLFVVEKDSDDSKDVGKIVTYEAVGFVTWLVQGALHNWSNSAKNNTRTWYEGNKGAASAGYTLHGMLTESKNAGWFPMLNWTFNGTRDSGGNNWVAADKTVTAWELSLNLTTILDQMTDDGLCEWTSSGTTLKMYRMGKMGVDRPDTVVGGRGFTSVPVRTDATGLYSHIRAVPDKLPWQNFSSDTSIRTRFGHRSIVLSQSGIETVAASAKNAQSYIEAGKEVVREESYDWVPTADLPHPWVDFDLGDQVTAHSRGGKQLRRVVALSVNQTGRDPAEVNMRAGKFIKSRAAKLKNRLESVAVGGIIGGSGAGMPLSSGPRNTIPAAPIGVRVTSNTAEWLEDGSALSSVTVAWDEVTEAEDGSEIDVVEYEVWSRTPSGNLARDIATRDTEVTISSWAAGRDRLIAVRTKSDLGDWSDFSTEFLITPTIPDSIIPKAPNNLRVVTNTGSWQPEAVSTIVVTWDKVTDSTDDKLISVATYEVLIDDSWYTVNDDTYSTTVTPGLSKTFRVRARTSLGVAGDMSGTLTVTGAAPATPVVKPSTPVLTSGFGNVFADWDGLYDVPGVLGMAHVRVMARTAGGSWVNQGTLTGAGQQIVTVGNIGDTVEVRLVGYDLLNRSTGTSAEATITVQGVERADLDQAVNDFLAGMETDISDAMGAANAAQGTAGNAQTAADQAAADALAAANAASAAQGAADDAQTTADAKGKVIIQSGVPSAADRLPQNLWIDTTSGGNTPKRWDGSNWVAVTDKAATDAAAAAVTAKSAADAAQAKADTAFTNAAAAATAAGQAQTTANAKNRVWYTNTAPPGTGHKIDDVWFDGANDNRINTWSGTAWVVRQMGTNAIANLAITNALIANLDAAKITTGELAAARVKMDAAFVNKMVANKVLVSGENLIKNTDFVGEAWTRTNGATSVEFAPIDGPDGRPAVTSAATSTVTYAAYYAGRQRDPQWAIPAREGEHFRASAWVYSPTTIAASTVAIGAIRFTEAGTRTAVAQYRNPEIPANTWVRISQDLPLLPTTRSFGIYSVVDATHTDAVYFSDFSVVRKTTGELIVDGTIKADKLDVGEIWGSEAWLNVLNTGIIKADYVEPNFGQNLNISANESVEFIVGRQVEQDTAIADAQDTASNAAGAADAASVTAATAAEAAAIADGKALVAQTQATNANDRITDQQAVFRVISTGAEVSSKDKTNAVRITPSGVSIVQGNQVASTWSAGRLTVNEAVLVRARVGNHIVERSGTSRTIFRPI